MRKIVFLFLSLILGGGIVCAQRSVGESVQQQDAFYLKLQQLRPTKAVKKQAKSLRKEGWEVPAGDDAMEKQLMRSRIYETEMMSDSTGKAVPRFIVLSDRKISRSFRLGYRAAYAGAQLELAGMLRTEIESVSSTDVRTMLGDGEETSVEVAHDRILASASEQVRNSIPVLVMFRRIEEDRVEVHVSLVFDRKTIYDRKCVF